MNIFFPIFSFFFLFIEQVSYPRAEDYVLEIENRNDEIDAVDFYPKKKTISNSNDNFDRKFR